MTGNTSLAQPRDLGTTSYTRANPLARLAPAFALALVNAATLDLVTHTLTLLVTVLVLPLTGLTLPRLTRVAWPLFVAAATLLVVNTLAYPSPGIQDADLRAGALTAVRLLAVTLPGLVAFTTIDAVDLVDSLVQQLRLSPRFGYGALAAMRLMPLLADDWSTQTMAARA
ncbi:MAG TPA: energy-coupling factor transporter transmembrane component T, partial [Actinomycetes bacterium]|nr:energy-coupling factor transporter transmembrane component T [Actinomycetes bacterium]